MQQKKLSGLDNEIESILSSDAADDVKAKNYIATLRRYRNYSSTPAVPQASDTLESDILSGVAPPVKYKAKQILKKLKNRTDFDLSKEGEIIFRQTKIPNTNIVDLLNDVLKTKNLEAPPVGWEALAATLKEANIPRDLVPNKVRWNYMHDKVKDRKTRDLRKSWIPY